MIKLREILDEIGIKSPYNLLTEAKTKTEKPSKILTDEFKKLINSNRESLKFENESIYVNIFDIFSKLSESEQKSCIKAFKNTNTIKEFSSVSGSWTIWKKFFDCRGVKGTRIGRGEVMAVLAIKGATSGGSKNKDLIIKGNSWEVKEQPNSIRMAKSGGIGKFNYVWETRVFYKLLEKIQLNNKDNDDQLKKSLSKIFSTKDIVNKIYNVLINNFRGDAFKPNKEDSAAGVTAENFFDRVSTNEWPEGVVSLHYQGFKILSKYSDAIRSNRDLLNNTKLILRTAKDKKDLEYYINPQHSDKIANAKPGQDITIQVASPAKGDNVEFLQIMLEIIRHPLVAEPEAILRDFIEVRDSYFKSSNLKGILWYWGNAGSQGEDPAMPHFGLPKDFTITSLSQQGGKIKLTSYAKQSTNIFVKALVDSDTQTTK